MGLIQKRKYWSLERLIGNIFLLNCGYLYFDIFCRPKEIDEAARRRFVKRLYVGLPNEADRGTIMKRLLKGEKFSITDEEFQLFATQTSGQRP